jgi:hypothetical protein
MTQPGTVFDLNDPNRKMCSLFLSLLDKADVHLKSFGDSTEPLSSLWSGSRGGGQCPCPPFFLPPASGFSARAPVGHRTGFG